MGGNAFPATCRIPSGTEFGDTFDHFKNILHNLFNIPLHAIRYPLFFESKQDHGDLDILVAGDHPNGLYEKLKEMGMETRKGGNTVHVLYHPRKSVAYQVDIEFMGKLTANEFNTAVRWHSYGGLGNILGYLSRWQGFFFKPDNLYFVLRHRHIYGPGNEQIIKAFSLGMSWLDIMEWLDVADTPDVYESQETFFKAVTGSQLFGTKLFTRENQSGEKIKRDKKRPIFNDFVSYIESRTDLPEYPQKNYIRHAVLEDLHLTNDILMAAADHMLGSMLGKRLNKLIPAPEPDEYAGFSARRKGWISNFSTLEVLIQPDKILEEKVRQLSPERAIWSREG